MKQTASSGLICGLDSRDDISYSSSASQITSSATWRMIHFLEAIIKNDGQWQRQQDLGSSRNSADTRPSSVPGRCICGNDFELCVETQRITIPWPFVKTVKTLPGPLPCLYACASSWWAKSHGSCASPQAWIVLPCNLPRPRKSLELLEESLQTHFQNWPPQARQYRPGRREPQWTPAWSIAGSTSWEWETYALMCMTWLRMRFDLCWINQQFLKHWHHRLWSSDCCVRSLKKRFPNRRNGLTTGWYFSSPHAPARCVSCHQHSGVIAFSRTYACTSSNVAFQEMSSKKLASILDKANHVTRPLAWPVKRFLEKLIPFLYIIQLSPKNPR